MIDTFSILFSTAMIVVLLLRAVKLDRALPWFQTLAPRTQAPSDPGPGPRGRAGTRPGTRPAGSGARPAGSPAGESPRGAGRGTPAAGVVRQPSSPGF